MKILTSSILIATFASLLLAQNFCEDYDIVINEINYNPSLELGQEDSDYEFIELYNYGNEDIDLDGWYVSIGNYYTSCGTFDDVTIEANSYLVLATNPDTYPGSIGLQSSWSDSFWLPNSGATITLRSSYYNIVDRVTYDDGCSSCGNNSYSCWPTNADAGGSSLELISPDLDNSLASSWQDSFVIPGGTPGYANSTDDGSIFGCIDVEACNFNPDATIDDGSCEYADENYDCDGNCIVGLDECGVCGGNGIAEGECDCAGNVDLGCGCGETGPSGCDNQCGSDAVLDECGVCDGDGVDADQDGICDDIDDCVGSYDVFDVCNGEGLIQDVINLASDGDELNIPSGVYPESILINKSVTLVCQDSCIIDARGISGSAVVIEASNVVFDGFTLLGDDTVYAGIIVTPSCQNTTVSNNVISGMTLANPNNSSPLSYGILAYGSSADQMPNNLNILNNEIFEISGTAISLGSYTNNTNISGNQLYDISAVDFLGEEISVGVQSEFAGGLSITNNLIADVIVGTNLIASEGSVNNNDYSNVVSFHTSSYPSYVNFEEDLEWWKAFSTLEALGQEISLVSYMSSLANAISVADQGTTITTDDGLEIIQDCAGVWGGDSIVDECGLCGGDGIIDDQCDCDGNTLDCNGICGGGSIVDECGVCGGNGIADGACDCNGNTLDCNGICGGGDVIDACGVCGGLAEEESSCPTSGFLLSLANYSVEDNSVDVVLNNESAIAGFQFDISGLEINSISSLNLNGDFSVYSSESTVIGFSLSGALIEPANASILRIFFNDSFSSDFCIINPILSGPNGLSVDVTVDDCFSSAGCTDDLACNYADYQYSCEDCCDYGTQYWLDTDGDGLGFASDEYLFCDDPGSPWVQNHGDDYPNCFSNFVDQCSVCDGDNTSCAGCTDENAFNYNCLNGNWPDTATYGCGDNVIVSDDSCFYPPEGYTFNQSTVQSFYKFIDGEINNEPLDYMGTWIGAFKDDICVGAWPWVGEFTCVPVMGNDGMDYSDGYMNDGEFPEFYIYDPELNASFPATVSENFPWIDLEIHHIDLISVDYDCAGVVDGDTIEDECGVCGGDGFLDNCLGTNSCENMDCFGVCGGDGFCDEASSGSWSDHGFILGDVNVDYQTNVVDITNQVSIILEAYSPNLYEVWASDINQDSYLNVVDAVRLSGNILGLAARANDKAEAYIQDNILYVSGPIGGIQFNGKLTSQVNEDDIVSSNNNKTVIYNLTTRLNTEYFKFEGVLEDLIVVASDGTSIDVEYIDSPFLVSAFPNPFNPYTIINFSIPLDSKVYVAIYDFNGRQIELLSNQYYDKGTYNITWDAKKYSSGIYFAKVIADSYIDIQKLTLIK